MDIEVQALLLVVTVPLMALMAYMWATGRGAMLIAGFNTSPKAMRNMYDSTALAKFVGMMVTAFSVILLLGMEALILAGSRPCSGSRSLLPWPYCSTGSIT